MGGDWGDAQGPDVIPPSGGATDHRDDIKIWGRQRVGISSGRGGNGLCGAPTNQIIHKEAVDGHGKEGGQLDCLLFSMEVERILQTSLMVRW